MVLIGVFGCVFHLHTYLHTYVYGHTCIVFTHFLQGYNSPKLNTQAQDLLNDCNSWCTWLVSFCCPVYVCLCTSLVPTIHLTIVYVSITIYRLIGVIHLICLCSPVEAIGNASAENQVAFGTFVDKPVETFVGTLGRFVLKQFLPFWAVQYSVLTDNISL